MPDPGSQLSQAAGDRVAGVLSPQLELLGAAPTPRIEALKRSVGRPAGARNKRHEDVARFVLEEFGDPLLHQAAIATMSLAELVALGLKVPEALAEKRLAAATVLPYLHQRQAIAVNVSQRLVHLTIEAGSPATPGASLVEIVGVVENQEVDEAADAAV